ncbi:acyltransferase family protein [Deinococcus ruber]|uniref:Acyltransferase n=1 Tax=Deinococcus ruber TaxID=1848197 RepID=A0A918CEQ1_9DEIO|nr:acyltransferase [Deinococcus ruber]GGR18945.1 acyltransferase [Deinococcus ruber]
MRYPALESLRGLAAVVVVIHHHLNIIFFPYPVDAKGIEALLLYTPLHLFWAGGEAVLLFFVLSGFVLSLGYWEGKGLDMQKFIVRRIWRIWIPFMAAVTIAYICIKLIGISPISILPAWFNGNWTQASPSVYLEHALMLGDMDRYSGAFIGTAWSLKWEMWGSLLLPVVLIWARQPVAIAIAICALFIALYWQRGAQTDVAEGLLRYMPMFAIGALLSYHRAFISHWVHLRNKPLLLAIALLLIPISWYGYSVINNPLRATINDYGVLLASSLLVSLSLGWKRFEVWLELPILHWLGRISFSLYLYHIVILTVALRLGWHILPISAILLISFLLVFPIAHFAYEWIEKPAIIKGKAIVAKLS